MGKKDYIEAAKLHRHIEGLEQEESLLPEDSNEHMKRAQEAGITRGFMALAFGGIQLGLLRAGRPFEAYRFVLLSSRFDGFPPSGIASVAFDVDYNSTCAAVLAGTGHGLDAPPPAERPAIRKHALVWLTSSLKDWQQHATALPVLAARSVSLAGSPFGGGPLLSVCCLSPERTDLSAERARGREVVHKRMNEWLQDADLAGVAMIRGSPNCRLRSANNGGNSGRKSGPCRDQTAPATTAPLPIRK